MSIQAANPAAMLPVSFGLPRAVAVTNGYRAIGFSTRSADEGLGQVREGTSCVLIRRSSRAQVTVFEVVSAVSVSRLNPVTASGFCRRPAARRRSASIFIALRVLVPP